MLGQHLVGNYRVRVTRQALDEVRRLMPRCKDRMRLRNHTLKLRFFPFTEESIRDNPLQVDWQWIWAKHGVTHMGELRIPEVIAGLKYLRALFYVPDQPILPGDTLPTIWILSVFRKQTNEISRTDVIRASSRQRLVYEEVYQKAASLTNHGVRRETNWLPNQKCH